MKSELFEHESMGVNMLLSHHGMINDIGSGGLCFATNEDVMEEDIR